MMLAVILFIKILAAFIYKQSVTYHFKHVESDEHNIALHITIMQTIIKL
jgi:hypothetical protein